MATKEAVTSNSGAGHVANVYSRLQLAAVEREKEAYIKALLTNPIKARVCVPIPLVKSEDVVMCRLRSEEINFLTRAFRSRILKSSSFINHANISICYCPNVLKSHSGTFSVSISNPDTTDVKLLVENAPISEGRFLLTNWPRSVPSAQNLYLNIECDGSDATNGTQLGLFKILWDEKPSFKMILEKDMQVINEIIPETDAVGKMFSNQTLEQFLNRLMLNGSEKNSLTRSMSYHINSNLRITELDESAERISTGLGSDKTKIGCSNRDDTTSSVLEVKIGDGFTESDAS
ncbi:movement protein [Tea plant line pattern virus]|uniref:movement protein n=1 Tax=Tea plant line pattern virus TaxID=2419940 RepID=UPI000EB66588|nr:movement protein [Tea plant line pattern virus]AYE53926.1 movement protein [Tea plant line pattern virus]